MRTSVFMTLLAVGVSSCDAPTSDQTEVPSAPTVSARPISDPVPMISQTSATDFKIAVEAQPRGDQVRVVAITNLPLPVEVMASVNLVGQKPDDVFIGTGGERMTVSEERTEFTVDAVDANGEPLPAGQYEVEVSFYPRWGAKNEAAKNVPDTEGLSKPFPLTNDEVSAGEAKQIKDRQRWVMLNVISRSPWDEQMFVSRLGKFEKSPSQLSRLHDAYYFPGADMTLIVNRLKGEVSVWRIGRASQ